MATPLFTFHLLPNAHLDPVWLWDYREGLNEGLITCRTILDLMDEIPALTFNRGESAIYQHIQRTDPATFARIKRHIKSGRWDVIGGTYIQPDTNLPATESMTRQYLEGVSYFQRELGVRPRIAWAADSFGHAAGLPEILAAAGMTGFAFTRPDPRVVPIAKPAFWWQGPGGSRVLGYRPRIGWYGTERTEITGRLEETLKLAPADGLTNVAVFCGLGNHGGGPTRRVIADALAWAKAHPEVRVVFSTMHRFFAAIHDEIRKTPSEYLPTHVGEMNFVLRGSYSSVAKFKFAFRKAQSEVGRTETTLTALQSAGLLKNAPDLHSPWQAILFNSFHDILPGSSIERAYDDQLAWLGGAVHDCQNAQLQALNALAQTLDTRVAKVQGDVPTGVPLLVFNPLPRPYKGFIEIEESLDYRPIWSYQNRAAEVPVRVLGPDRKPLPYQKIATEHSAMPHLPWRFRVIVPVELPACGWNVLEMAYVEGSTVPALAPPAVAAKDGLIDNGHYRVTARPGDPGIQITHHGKSIFAKHEKFAGLTAITVEDPWGSWGGMDESLESLRLDNIRDRWVVSGVTTIEAGPIRGSLRVELQGGNRGSRLVLTFTLTADRDAVDIAARVFWNERSARLKLLFPVGDQAEFDVCGAQIRRPPVGEVPGGRWVRITGPTGTCGFASDSLYSFECRDGLFCPTVVRASRYANDVPTKPDEALHLPAVDAGELLFRCLISPGGQELPRLAEELERPLLVLPVPPHDGLGKRRGELFALTPNTLEMLALKPAQDGNGLVLRVRETSGKPARATVKIGGQKVSLETVPANRIASWRLTCRSNRWTAVPITSVEEKLPKSS